MPILTERAAFVLSAYLSEAFRASIVIPPILADSVDKSLVLDGRYCNFIRLLPTVQQRAVDGAKMSFLLPFVAKSGFMGATLAQDVADAVNEALKTAYEEIVVPTFFYPDGSAMCVVFDPKMLGLAIKTLEGHPDLLEG